MRDAGELRFFGASSNFNLVPNHSLKVASSVEARNRGITAAQQMPGFFEPSAELRDHLLSLFWRWQNSWQYLVPRESFVLDLYVNKSGRFCTPLLLTAMLALASRYSSRLELRTDPDDANTAGDIFAAQGKAMLQFEYDAPTTSTVQATALLGLFWASIDNEGLGFMYIGMASRMAMNLGLQSDCTSYASKGLVSEEDVEARNVAFWGVYVLDKLYCLGMGRPASIQEYNITTRKPKIQDRPISLLSEEQTSISQPWPTSHITENAMRTYLKTTGPDRRSDAMRCLLVCIKTLYEMNTNWDWANRSIRAIRSLAEQWGVDIWTEDLEDELGEENRRQFELYQRGCLPNGQMGEPNNETEQTYPAEVFDELFQAWTYDQNLTNMAFNFFDESSSIVE
ncbi:hypothetical protein QQX98_008571 [Neonectria punicea]|uniref:Xylanolytic transcriptional activator regulatory domain-containing protein n=1 Tax=Neonectria punicea TaxID=979145 RepID=A0ABR1GUT6_9HYPO